MNFIGKFSHPQITAKGDPRAHVPFTRMKTLWFNTGTLCNITCANCYIESSPRNDSLVYLRRSDIIPFLNELDTAGECPIEIGFTGGEPFMAPEILGMLEEALVRRHEVLLLTNAMRPMMRPRVMRGLLELQESFGQQILLRVSLDHYTAEKHDEERGRGSFSLALQGLRWLSGQGFRLAIAGRTLWEESQDSAQAGYEELLSREGLSIDAAQALVLFPEMRVEADPPEISTGCWKVLSSRPEDQMCSSQRMVVRRKGSSGACVVSCTLLPHESAFELGATLQESRCDVALNHRYCASFCVLGGASCS